MGTTLRAMKRIADIKARRERVHYLTRMAGKAARERKEAVRTVQQHIELVDVPELRERVAERLAATTIKAKADVEMA